MRMGRDQEQMKKDPCIIKSKNENLNLLVEKFPMFIRKKIRDKGTFHEKRALKRLNPHQQPTLTLNMKNKDTLR